MIAMLIALALVATLAAAAPSGLPEVRSDPRFELFGMVQLLAGADKRYSGFHRSDLPYTRAAEAWFKPFVRHPVVELYERLAAKGLDEIFFHNYIFSLGDPPALEPREPFGPVGLSAAGGDESMEPFRLLLVDFARVSRFESFAAEAAPSLKDMSEEVSRQAAALDAITRLERYTGLPAQRRYTLIVSPFVEPALASSWARGKADARHITSLYGPEEVSGQVVFRLHTRAGGIWSGLLFDQLGPAARRHRVRINRSKALFAPLGGACAADWYDCVQRHISFAVAARLLDLTGDQESAREWPVKYARIGLPYIGALAQRLREFEADRTRYPTLLEFYPRLMEELEVLAKEGPAPIPFQGGISAVLNDPAAITVILPGAEAPGVGEALRILAKKRWTRAAFMSDEAALKADLKGQTLIVLGTLQGNRWLERRFSELQLPLRLENSSVFFDARPGETSRQQFTGKLGLISTAVNPVDASRGLLIYTAVESGLLTSMGGSYIGPADFLIEESGVVLKLGRYEKTRRPWRLK